MSSNMSDTAIIVENLGKKYFLGQKNTGKRYKTLQEEILSLPGKLFSKKSDSQEFWALKNVSFEVKKGEVLGIIGRNGAGKSTLLKILSRITDPTEGRVDIYGRVGSLLEVGTGFHPELTGRENIYLSGAILGLKRWEIRKKFDEIVEFAEISEFIDTPAKRYSSGMYMRLAFAVAAHLEPEILVVDEVLAVGDMEFQKKCLGKMEQVSKGGRTVLFVSHNLTAIQTLCLNTLYLKSGSVITVDKTNIAIEKYTQSGILFKHRKNWDNDEIYNEYVQPKSLYLQYCQNTHVNGIDVNTPFQIVFEFNCLKENIILNTSLLLYTQNGTTVFNTGSQAEHFKRGRVRSICKIPPKLLNDEAYSIRILIIKDTADVLIDIYDVIKFHVIDVPRRGIWQGKWLGVVRPHIEWTTVQEFPISK